MPNERKLQALADQLLAATKGGSVRWTVAGDDRFQLSLPHGAVTIDRAAYPAMHVFDDSGNLVESLQETQAPQPWDDVLRDLLEAARNSALNIEQVLDSILKDVESAGKAPADDDIPF
jgi:hypothetical protein